MADSIETLKELALLIRNATKTGENTAERVGRTLVGIVENLSSIDIEELNKKYLRKDQEDETTFLLRLLAGVEFGKYVPGLLGTGGAVLIDKDCNSHAEFDYLTIRKLAVFFELLVQEMKYVGGAFIVSPAGLKVSRVVEQSDSYRCYFDQHDGDRTVHNQFTVGAQARRQTFNLDNQAYYWRLVTAVGDDWIDLSKDDCDTGSTVPEAGDEIVQLGHRTDKTRQSAIIISAFGSDAPSIKYYQGIDSYSLVDKAIQADYFDQSTGRFKSVTYGDKYIGDPDRSSYFDFVQGEGVNIKGRVHITGGSGWKNLDGLEGVVQGAVDDAKNAQITADKAALDAKTAQTEAKAASGRLDEWASDSVISPTEKTALKQELADLQSDYDTNSKNAEKYSIDFSGYTTAWTAYKAELEYHSTAEPENIPVRDTFKTAQAQFYTARTSLLDKIASAAKEYAEKLVNGVGVGAENLLRNTGFTGDYTTRQLTSTTSLNQNTSLYSDRLAHWTGTGSVVEDTESVSGFACKIGSLAQVVNLIAGESYVISCKAKGTSLSVSCGGFTETIALAGTYGICSFKFTYVSGGVFMISGNATICEIKMERGTIRTDWCPSRLDKNQLADDFKHLWYLQDALKGSTSILGGLILSTMIQLGQWQNDELKKVTAVLSGIYNDDDDVALAAGGDLEKAIYTVSLFRDDPTHELTDSELKKIANAVLTHGGRIILNDAILRGYIYALGGIFKGQVSIANGKILLNTDGSGSLANGNIVWDAAGNVDFKADIICTANGYTLKIQRDFSDIRIYDSKERLVLAIQPFFDRPGSSPTISLSMPDLDASARLTADGLSVTSGNESSYIGSSIVSFADAEGRYDGFTGRVDLRDSNALYFKNGVLYSAKRE